MWENAFTDAPGYFDESSAREKQPLELHSIKELKQFLDWLHIKHCLLKPYFENEDYPVVEARELLPSFEIDLYEYKKLPGFSMVAFERPLNAFREIFQFDALHTLFDWQHADIDSEACLLESSVFAANLRTFQSRLPKRSHQDFLEEFGERDICGLESYDNLLKFLLQLERAHILSHDSAGHFSLAGIYASLPSNLDSELKQFGLKIGKFKPGDNFMYECNRLFVYQFLMELHGFPIVSERRTSASLFARRLQRMGERFMVRVLGQSDRTITTLYTRDDRKKTHQFPQVEKIALVAVNPKQTETIELLDDQGFLIDRQNNICILRVIYQQHQYSPKNVREDRALSVLRQEIIHPITGRVLDHLNIIQNAQNMIYRLNDIVRGELRGTITYKRREIIRNTDSHDKRLKFLYSWLSKHTHRLVDYSDEFYAQVVKVLDGYLLTPENWDIFNEHADLHKEVWNKYSQIQQSRKVRTLEELRQRVYKCEKISYLKMLELMTEILGELKYEIVNYFDRVVAKVLVIGDDVVSDSYLRKNYIDKKDENLTEYGRNVKKYYGRLVALLDEFKSIRKSRTTTMASQNLHHY
ncbi:hypothetical protein [Pseudodesulfovibrio senegalensis]|jgi:hypothetical protein|uniref:Uncharacterized protein n=1 Tax=Pseudodesulfovibrio senegalensis TaxID=1721087 RepID=A0A6N6N107_9BACT|nr:hypothetical protein [Pseudodesulfovibrio senegalensis]KAB1441062.1 hypothetical protein F8A88_11515 [Pseudodesulfovibrio senegalensis]